MLIVFLFFAAFMIHDFWAVPDQQKQTVRVNFTKNIARAGAALMMLTFAGVAWPFSVGG